MIAFFCPDGVAPNLGKFFGAVVELGKYLRAADLRFDQRVLSTFYLARDAGDGRARHGSRLVDHGQFF